MLSVRKRGQYFHVRGTVSWGENSTYIEKSTRTASKKEALEYAHALEAKCIKRFKNGGKRTNDEVTFDECLDLYLTEKEKNIKIGEIQKINALLPYYSGVSVSGLKEKFISYRNDNPNLAPATYVRYEGIIKAIVNNATDTLGFQVEKTTKKNK